MGFFSDLIAEIKGGPVGIDGMKQALEIFRCEHRMSWDDFEKLNKEIFEERRHSFTRQYRPEEIHSHQVQSFISKVWEILKDD